MSLAGKVVWSIFLTFFVIAITIIEIVMVKLETKPKKCTAVIKGVVIRYKYVCSSGGMSFWLPVAEYVVNGIHYTAWGPRFSGYSTTTRTAPNTGIESERSWYVTPDGTLMVNVRRNSFFSVTRSTGEDMYPRGTTVDIYYDPKKPKRAFVIAYFRRTWVPVLVGAVCVSTYLVMALSLTLIWMMG